MTDQDLAEIKFRKMSHLNLGTQHACTYESVDYEPRISVCVHTPVREDGMYGRAFVHYYLNGVVYKSKKKFLEAMTELENESKSKGK